MLSRFHMYAIKMMPALLAILMGDSHLICVISGSGKARIEDKN